MTYFLDVVLISVLIPDDEAVLFTGDSSGMELLVTECESWISSWIEELSLSPLFGRLDFSLVVEVGVVVDVACDSSGMELDVLVPLVEAVFTDGSVAMLSETGAGFSAFSVPS